MQPREQGSPGSQRRELPDLVVSGCRALRGLPTSRWSPRTGSPARAEVRHGRDYEKRWAVPGPRAVAVPWTTSVMSGQLTRRSSSLLPGSSTPRSSLTTTRSSQAAGRPAGACQRGKWSPRTDPRPSSELVARCGARLLSLMTPVCPRRATGSGLQRSPAISGRRRVDEAGGGIVDLVSRRERRPPRHCGLGGLRAGCRRSPGGATPAPITPAPASRRRDRAPLHRGVSCGRSRPALPLSSAGG
jgi:hypothetical protein